MSVKTQPDTENLEAYCPRKVSPDEYEASRHFQQQKKWRNMNGDWIPELILEGELVPDTPENCGKGEADTFHFVKEIEFHEWHMVVTYNDDGPNTIQTAFVPGFEKEDYDRYFK